MVFLHPLKDEKDSKGNVYSSISKLKGVTNVSKPTKINSQLGGKVLKVKRDLYSTESLPKSKTLKFNRNEYKVSLASTLKKNNIVGERKCYNLQKKLPSLVEEEKKEVVIEKELGKIDEEDDINEISNDYGKLNCMTPYKLYPTYFDFPKKLLFLSEVGSISSNCLKALSKSDIDEDEVDDGVEENIIKRYIGRTTVGWDEKGMHYWLHKINQSNVFLPLIEEVGGPRNSWFQLHICEDCTQKMSSSYKLCNVKTKTTKSYCSTVSKSNELCNPQIYSQYTNYPLFKNKSLQIKCDEGEGKQIPRNNEYFRRLVFSSNSCGLNFEVLDDEKQSKKKVKEDNEDFYDTINKYVKVVVFGTDPCGFSFPIDIHSDRSSQHSIYKEMSRVSFKFSDIHSENISKELPRLTYEPNSLGNSKRNTIKPKSDAEASKFKSINDKLEPSDYVNNKYPIQSNSSITLPSRSEIQSSVVANSPKATFLTNVCNGESKMPKNKKHEVKNELISVSDTTTTYRTLTMKKLKRYKSLPIEMPQDNASSSFIKLNQYDSSEKTIRKALCPGAGKLLELSLGKNKVNQINSNSLWRLIKRKTKKNELSQPFLLHFPDSSSVRVRLVYFGNNTNRVFVQGKSEYWKDPIGRRPEKHSSGILARLFSKNLFIFMYLSFISFCILSYLLVVDSLDFSSPPPPPPPPKKWYEFYN